MNLTFLKKMSDDFQVKLASYKKMTRYYNAKVNKRSFCIGDLVLRKVFFSSKDQGVGILGTN